MSNKMYTLVMLRHGESQWNQENRFTGWTDVPLSAKGENEAILAAKLLTDEGFKFDVAYTSVLKRAVHTLWIVLKAIDQSYIPIINSWRLNERHYGALQGLNKVETAKKHSEQQVKIWRRSYDVPPPPLADDDERSMKNARHFKGLPKDIFPESECLKDTVARVLPYWYDEVAPAILRGDEVLIVAHGNSIRALMKHIDKVSDADIVDLNIPTGVPLVYKFDENLNPIKHYYLLDEEEVKRRMDAVADQATIK